MRFSNLQECVQSAIQCQHANARQFYYVYVIQFSKQCLLNRVIEQLPRIVSNAETPQEQTNPHRISGLASHRLQLCIIFKFINTGMKCYDQSVWEKKHSEFRWLLILRRFSSPQLAASFNKMQQTQYLAACLRGGLSCKYRRSEKNGFFCWHECANETH